MPDMLKVFAGKFENCREQEKNFWQIERNSQ